MDPTTADLIAKLSVPLIGTLFSVLGVIITAEINARLKDKQAAAVISTAVQNALGAMEQEAIDAANGTADTLTAHDKILVGVRYVVQHARSEVKRFGIDEDMIADKIRAKQGLRALAIADAVQVNKKSAVVVPSVPLQPLPKPWIPHQPGGLPS